MDNSLASLKPFVNDPRFQTAFQDYLVVKLAQVHKELEQASDLLTVGKWQGQASLIKRLMKIREEVNGGAN